MNIINVRSTSNMVFLWLCGVLFSLSLLVANAGTIGELSEYTF